MATVTEIQDNAYTRINALTQEATVVLNEYKDQAAAIADEWNFVDFNTSNFSVTPVGDIDGIDAIEGLDELRNLVLNLNPGDYMDDTFKKHVYESAFFDFLEPKLIEFITQESTGIAEDVQDALFDNMYERDIRTLNDSIDQMERLHGGRGFPIPTSMLLAARNELISRYQDNKDNRNREVTALIAERAQQNVMHSIDAGIKMEDIQSRFTLTFARQWLDTLGFIVTKYNAEVAAAIANVEASIKEQALNLEANIANGKIDEGNAQRYIEQWRIRTTNEIAETKAMIEQALSSYQMQLSATKDIMTYYTGSVSAALNQITGLSVINE